MSLNLAPPVGNVALYKCVATGLLPMWVLFLAVNERNL
jgi:hypothetical protein